MTKELKTNAISAAAEKTTVFCFVECVWQPVPEGGLPLCLQPP